MTPAKKSNGRKGAAKKSASKSPAKRTGKSPAAKKTKRTAVKKGTKKGAKKSAKKSAKKTTKKTAGQSAKNAAKKSGKKAGAKKNTQTQKNTALPGRLRSLDSQDLIHGLAAGLVRVGEGVDRARDEVVAGAALARRAAGTGRQRIQEAGAAARLRLQQTREQGTAGETLATARGISVGTLMRLGDVRDEFLVRLSEGTEELARRAREARERGEDFYARHREEILALTITAIKIAAVIGVRRLTAPRKKEGDGKRSRKGDVVAVVGALLGQVGQLLAHQPSALPLLREVYRKGDPGEQAVVGLLLGPTLHQDPEHALEVIEEFLEGASEEPAADTIARRTLAPLLEDHPELIEHVTPWVRAAAPLVKRGALIALTTVLRDRRSRIGDMVAVAVIVLEDHDEEVRDALSWFLETASDVDLEMTARTVADWIKTRGADVEEAVQNLPAPLRKRVKDLAEDDRPSSWDG